VPDDRYEAPVNNVTEEALGVSLKRSMRLVENEFPLQTGIIIFVFDFGPGGGVGYIANGDRLDCIHMLEVWIKRQRELS
jgi:hypothetical protein